MHDPSATASRTAGLLSRDGSAHVVEATIRSFRRHAFHDVTLERVAAESGVGLDEILAEFPTWDRLVEATLDRWTAQRLHAVVPIAQESGAVAFLRAVVTWNTADPALMRLLSALVNVAGTPDHPLSGYLQQKWLHFSAHVQRTLAADIADGRESASMEAPRGAEQLIAIYDGLQLQALVRPSMDLVEAFDRAVTRFRLGWARRDADPVWQV